MPSPAEPVPQVPPDEAVSVSELTGAVRDVLSGTFDAVFVRGEISQWRPSAAGHVYFTLKDAGAVLPCVLWRSQAQRLRLQPDEGLEVLVRGALDVYPPHGRYQLQVRTLEAVGAGALQRAFERLRQRLEAEGLFRPETKVPLPAFPRRVALVTSPTGAAIRDLVTVIHRRLPSTTLLLVPVRVQGAGAAEEIARGLTFADRAARADVIIVGRGGGSLEDLWAFNEEVVARAIFACHTPVVSAVGHEADVTISDLVADVRAATPSQAGELVVPDRADLTERVEEARGRLANRLRTRLDRLWQRVESLADRPVLSAGLGLLEPRRRTLEHLAARLLARSPGAGLRRQRERLLELRHRADRAIRGRWTAAVGQLGSLDRALRALSPLSVLERGYSLAYAPSGRLARRAGDLAPGDALRTHLADGAEVTSRVERVEGSARGGT